MIPSGFHFFIFRNRNVYTTMSLALLRTPNLQDQISVFISSGERLSHEHPQASGSLFNAFFDSQGYGWAVPTHLHTLRMSIIMFKTFFQSSPSRLSRRHPQTLFSWKQQWCYHPIYLRLRNCCSILVYGLKYCNIHLSHVLKYNSIPNDNSCAYREYIWPPYTNLK
jgi:hypothetical protein